MLHATGKSLKMLIFCKNMSVRPMLSPQKVKYVLNWCFLGMEKLSYSVPITFLTPEVVFNMTMF